MEDELLIELIEDCNDYSKLQLILNNLISSGIFLITKSKKNNNIITLNNNNTIINCREDIISSYRTELDINGEYTEWNKKPNIDPLLLISALPSPDLKNAQKSFQKSLSIIIQLATKINQINEKLNKKLLNRPTRNQSFPEARDDRSRSPVPCPLPCRQSCVLTR